MTDLTLFHASPSRSSITLWMMEELGQPYDLELIDLAKGDQLTADYAALNPMGKVPALRHKGVMVTEVAAICTYLADEFPKAGLNIPVGQPERGVYLKWLFFGPSVFEPAMTDKNYPRASEAPARAVGWRPLPQVLDVIESGLKPGPYLMGARFTAADVVIGSSLRWGMMFGMLEPRPRFKAYVAQLEERPALKRANERDAALRSPSADRQ
jgi:glutathione S-transferase